MTAELYSIDFPNGKKYIGISKNAKSRFSRHLSLAKRGSELPVHRAMRKYHADVKVSVLAIGTREYILDLEVAAISAYGTRSVSAGYNTTIGGENGFAGGKHSGSTKAAWSKKRKGTRWSDESRAKLSSTLKGRPDSVSKEGRLKISLAVSAANKGRVPHNKGVPLSEEQKRKLSVANKGKKHSPETRAKMSGSQRGREISEEHRRKLSEAQRGMKYSDEARAKMSASAKARHAYERMRKTVEFS